MGKLIDLYVKKVGGGGGAGSPTEIRDALSSLQTTARLPSTAIRQPVMDVDAGVFIMGQSVEAGATSNTVNGLGRRGFINAPRQGFFEPLPSAPGASGSPFTGIVDRLADHGIRVVTYFNGALGGASLINEYCGSYRAWAANTAFRGKRDVSLGTDDPGHRGELVWANGMVWECTTGNRHLAFLNLTYAEANITFAGASLRRTQNMVTKETTLLSGATAPAWPATPALGNTVPDGALVWTAIRAVATQPPTGDPVFWAHDGFDPYYAIARVKTAATRAPTAHRYIFIQNGQSDQGRSSAVYARAIAGMMAHIMFGQPTGIRFVIGLSIGATAAGHTDAGWDALETAISNSGRSGTPDYVTNPLTALYASHAVRRGVLGESPVNSGTAYIRKSWYREFGRNASMLQSDGLHLLPPSVETVADFDAPQIAQIIRNQP